MTVPIASITCARAVKRVRVDPSAVWILIAGLLCFLLISAGSAIAQWILYTSSYNPIPTGVAVVALFRGCAPVIADLICAVFLALHGYKSLRRRLAQLDERAEAVEKIYARQVVIIEREEKLRKEREDAEAERRRRDKREEMLDRVQEMQTTSMLDAMEYVLTIPQKSTVNSSANGSRQQRGY
jgi:membrane protein implicated in regulation of membrane protease activity